MANQITRGTKASGGTAFLDGTTAYGSEVETDTSTVYTAWNNSDAGTNTWANVNATASTITTATITTLTHGLMKYRHPVLQYASATVVNIETGLNGTSGQATILFPDGSLRTDSTTTRINCNLAQVAALSGTAQSGLQTGTVAANTWYYIYAVKTSDNSSNFVTVADTLNGPFQSKFATLNSNFGTNSWVYLGLIRYGDNSGTTTAILNFVQAGNTTLFVNTCAGSSRNSNGTRLANTAGATTLTWTYATGTGTTQIPSNVTIGIATGVTNTASNGYWLTDASTTNYYAMMLNANGSGGGGSRATVYLPNSLVGTITNSGSAAQDLFLSGFVDGVLGIGANPLL